MKIAIVGTGISGLVAAHALHGRHELTLFEASDWIGGHSHTVDVPLPGGGAQPVDTGFIVFNRKTYPRFSALLQELGVPVQESDMSFSVRCERTGFEYEGSGWNGLLAQRRNVLRPRFWSMLRDILRFYREAAATLEGPDDGGTLGEFLAQGGYGAPFVEQHLVPMASAVWSARAEDLHEFPLRFLVRFFHNHGFLAVDGRPTWLTVSGGSRRYVETLVEPFRARIRLRTPVTRVARTPGLQGVLVRTRDGQEERFERVILATHADTSLRLLAEPTARERAILGCFAYQANDVVLHTDTRLMPRARRAWASWNYHLAAPPSPLPTVTYWMNRLQRLPDERPYFVTLNRTPEIDPARILARFTYDHPQYTRAAFAAQSRHGEIDGVAGVHFCGAYWGYGFHEDGVQSGLAVVANVPTEVPA